MFEKHYEVRYSEVGCDARATAAAVMSYLQDTSLAHSETVGQTLQTLQGEQLAWILLSWHVRIARYPACGERLTARTWATGFEKVYGYRDFELLDADGRELAAASSVWTLMDLAARRPRRVTPEIVADYGTEERRVFEAEGAWKIKPPERYEELDRFRVRRSDLDTNRHVNNINYLRMLSDCLPEGSALAEFWINFRHAAKLGDTVVAGLASGSGREACVLHAPDGEAFAVMEYVLR